MSKITDEQKKFIEISKQYEALKEQMKEIKPQLDELLTKIGIGTFFQDPETKLVYRVSVPNGRFVYFDTIGYDRTKKETETKGSLSKKDAEGAGFEI